MCDTLIFVYQIFRLKMKEDFLINLVFKNFQFRWNNSVENIFCCYRFLCLSYNPDYSRIKDKYKFYKNANCF